uniref:Uncharacterized protein n=1 Tax=Kalanchoe fedtschenkoi TaxID=63787 RepID=A0A7N0RE98_KALFE
MHWKRSDSWLCLSSLKLSSEMITSTWFSAAFRFILLCIYSFRGLESLALGEYFYTFEVSMSVDLNFLELKECRKYIICKWNVVLM